MFQKINHLVLLVVFAISANVFSQQADEELSRLRPAPPKPVAHSELKDSINRGVKHLLDSQRKDGAWGGPQWTGGVDSDPFGSFPSFDVAVTAMCLEALMDVDDVDGLQEANEKAYKFLMDRTDKIKRAGPGDLPNVWAHCYCIQTFAKIYSRTSDDKKKAELKEAIQRHWKGLKRWESIHGGWFYYGRGMSKPINPSCSFVNAAILVALKRSTNVGITGNTDMIQRALKATKRMRKPDSSFIYTMRLPTDSGAMRPINRPSGSLGRSQAGNVALRQWEDKRITDDVLSLWLDRLISRHGWLDMGRKKPIPHESFAAVAGYFYYFGCYYGSLCIQELPADQRGFYQHHLARLIIDRQEKDGSWFDYPLYSYHKPYGTAFALLTLQNCRVGQ